MSSDSEKIDHETGRHHDTSFVENGNGAPLGRQVTVTLSPEQYERMFFQPGAPAKGDLAKRFANPTLLGVLGFLIPYTSTILILCQFQGAVPPYSLAGLSGDYYFLGSIAMVLAGIGEFILGNTLPFVVFVIYGTHWGSLAYTQDPIHRTTSAFETEGGALGAPYNSSQGFHNITMCIVSFMLMIGQLRVNVPLFLTFFGLVFLFAFIAAADFATPNIVTPADGEHVLMLLKVGGGFGMLGVICGWYLVLLEVCDTVGLPCPLPVFDLSSKVFPKERKMQ